uniref:SSD domain-containing protein n=1 Tax=Meloidogyne floridensis TaxID=298350 RepID=A0A915NRK2_9BILA
MIRLTTDPVELWSSPGSDAREQKEFFDNNFGPFYRTEQIIIVPKDQSFWEREDSSNFLKKVRIGPVFRKNFLKASFSLYKQILELNTSLDNDKRVVTLSDICFKPQWPQNPHCVVMSIFNYFQNNITKLDLEDDSTFNTFDYIDHLFDCLENPYQMSSKLQISCLGQFGGPVQPYVVLGDFEEPGKYETARGLVITLLVNNYKNNEENFKNKNSLALAWEKKFIKLLKTHKSEVFNVTFIAERSLEDEIARQSKSDALTVFLSYMFMFIYVAFALGHYSGFGRELCLPFIHSKFTLGIFGIFGCILSVSSSIGLFAFFNMSASLIILEVEPFLVLAVGVDNIFIFVHSYQRLANNINQPLPERISIICADVMPSMLLSSLSEFFCFSLGALSSMPAVQMFSLYAAVAILLNFLLQITFFLSVFSSRLEFCCCLKLNNNSNSDQPTESRVEHLMRQFYAPTLLNKYIRIFVVVFFALWLASSSAIMNRIKAGLDQKMAVPEDSYVLAHFLNMEQYLAVGPPIYFVLRGEYDYHDYILRNQVCSSSGCSANSLGAQIARAAKFPERSYIAHPAMNWVDDYLDWLKPVGYCCRQFNSNNTFCPSNINITNICHHCTVSPLQGHPDYNRFYEFLPNFLEENPSSYCPRAGHPTHGFALNLSEKEKQNSTNEFRLRVLASYFMTYHTKLSSSEDFIRAMESAQLISQNITRDINQILTSLNRKHIEIFPYSPFYVFYEQYRGIVKTAILQVIVIALILLNMVGSMWWWAIDFNAISVVNLVMSVGISVEFCAHIVRAFTLSLKPTRLERASDSLCSVGCSVLSGITMTKLGGIFVLAFAHSKIFKIYYFRMYLNIVLIGAAHGLILLPVLLSYCGPPINRRRLFINNLNKNKSKFITNNNIIKLPYGTRNNKNKQNEVCSTLLQH